MADTLLSAEDYETILQNRFKDEEVKFIKAELKPISDKVEGFLGEHYNLQITYSSEGEINTVIFFMKTRPIKNEVQKNISLEIDVYKKEIFIYDVLLKEFEKYGYDISFAARSYYCIPNQTLILENLLQNKYKQSDKNITFNLDQTKSVLKSLAMLHAASFAYERTKTKELNRPYSLEKEYSIYMEEKLITMFTNSTTFTVKWWKNCFKTLEALVNILPKDEQYKKDFQTLLNNFPFGKVLIDKRNLAKTCNHGDLWCNNLLFKQDKKSSSDCKLVDFQLCRYAYPSFDLVLAIYFNTRADLRKNYLKDLFHFYYDTLKDYLFRYGYPIEGIIPQDDFHESIRIVKADVLLQVVSCVIIIYLPSEKITGAVHVDEGALTDVIFNNTEMCSKAFLNDDTYKEIVVEIMDELKSAMMDLT